MARGYKTKEIFNDMSPDHTKIVFVTVINDVTRYHLLYYIFSDLLHVMMIISFEWKKIFQEIIMLHTATVCTS